MGSIFFPSDGKFERRNMEEWWSTAVKTIQFGVPPPIFLHKTSQTPLGWSEIRCPKFWDVGPWFSVNTVLDKITKKWGHHSTSLRIRNHSMSRSSGLVVKPMTSRCLSKWEPQALYSGGEKGSNSTASGKPEVLNEDVRFLLREPGTTTTRKLQDLDEGTMDGRSVVESRSSGYEEPLSWSFWYQWSAQQCRK